MRIILRHLCLALLLLCGLVLPANAQLFGIFGDSDASAEEEKGAFLTYVEEKLSTPDRRISISNINGVLSSKASIDKITISDEKGVWLTITNAAIDWNRSALLRARLEIESLSAESIVMTRNPAPVEAEMEAEATPFALPELPVAIRIGELAIQRAEFDESVFGLASVLSLQGALTLEDGALDTSLQVQRLDGPGGELALQAAYSNENRQLDVDLQLDEPENGIVANLLNIEGKPPVSLALQGAGPLSDLTLQLTLDADRERVLSGTFNLDETEQGLAYRANLEGPLGRLVPVQFRAFFSGQSTLRLSGSVPDEGGTVIDQLALKSGPLSLEGRARVLSGGFLRTLVLDGQIDGGDGEPVILPVPGGETSVRRASIDIEYGVDETGPWSGRILLQNLNTGTFAAESVRFDLGGQMTALDSTQNRAVSFNVDGVAEGITAERAAVADALGDRLTFTLAGQTEAGQPIAIETLKLDGQSVDIATNGTLDGAVYRGTTSITTASLAPFSTMAGQKLTGALDISTEGSVTLNSGAFDLTVDGSASNITLEDPTLTRLLAGETTLSGGIARGEQGISTDDFKLENPQLQLAANGSYGGDDTDMKVTGRLADLASITDQVSGAVQFDASLIGESNSISVKSNLGIPQGRLQGRNLTDLGLELVGTLGDNLFSGHVTGEGFFSGERLAIDSDVVYGEGAIRLSELELAVGGNRVQGDFERDGTGLLAGDLSVDAPNLELVGALALQDIAGAIDADLSFSNLDGRQDAAVKGTISGFRYDTTAKIGEAALDITATDLFGVPQASGSINGRTISAGGVDFTVLDLKADQQENATDFVLSGELEQGTDISAEGTLARVQDADVSPAFDLALRELSIVEAGRTARLEAPTEISVRGQTIAIDATTLAIGDGSLRLQGEVAEQINLSVVADSVSLDIANAVRPDLEAAGTISGTAEITGPRSAPSVAFDVTGEGLTVAQLKDASIAPLSIRARGQTDGRSLDVDATLTNSQGVNATINGAVPLGSEGRLDLKVDLNAVPLELANTVRPDLEADGTISGTATVTGNLSNPNVNFRLAGNGVTVAQLRQNGVAPLSIQANGETNGQTLTIDANATNSQGVRLAANGTVPLGGEGALAVNIDVNAVPLSLANSVRPDLGLSGTLTGSARVTGSLSSPNADFQLSVPNLDAAALQGFGPLSVDTQGRFANQAVQLNRLNIGGRDGIALSASGTIPLSEGGLNVSFDGSAPLSAANRFLGDRGTTLAGSVRFSGRATGALADPNIAISVDTGGASLFDPQTNTRLTNINISASATRQQVVLQSASANLASGGSVAASGTIGLTNGLPANITIRLNQARYADGKFIAATVNGTISITGSLANDPLIAGNIDVVRAEITVPDSFGSSVDIQAVNHINAPADVRATLARAFPGSGGSIPEPAARPSVPRLDITLNAPNQIFVRGRGLDAELGGRLRLTGSTRDIQPVGGFELIRGRLAILGKRITFERGTITFVGDLNPYLNFVASSDADGTTIFIRVQGTVDDLDISFSSDSQLPEDEALALLIFGRGLDQLSPLQLAQLAAAAAELAGNGPSVLSGVRQAAGLDNLDIVTDSEGNVAARAGTYVSENVYVGVEAGSESKVTINLDVTEEITVRGAVGTESSVGVFYEKDY
ncbi:translocation/assembly module TamB domain-containing protein [Notoacmeibacter sp. MSK16QG-6]|uniref:translocation/assembly module TamB domain-containing protein n=1 Tax=Notoacmeibacter sp. MSK16QG-6 TaxID=2957982 RepID=UPI00209EFAB5|nr:translocation/assembly module TamB domain-containing protein [Notoacmeibacter sp. MSK16QG-6]MCP1200394.1 translocation/assembly module TamB domain-containing protein [Notoacmeibacter sp. MSK16QG-6]